jgi:hypothetical protein
MEPRLGRMRRWRPYRDVPHLDNFYGGALEVIDHRAPILDGVMKAEDDCCDAMMINATECIGTSWRSSRAPQRSRTG